MDKKKIITPLAIALLLIALIGATYAYFTAQAGGTTSRNVSVTSNTTDNLSFQISNDISFTVTQATFAENAGNRDGYATATAILTPNNNTGSATMNYYLYLVLDSNPTVYSEENTNELPELMLQLFDSSNQLVTLSNLGSQETVGAVIGYDITGLEGKVALLSNQTISASNNQATTQTWKAVITLINHNFNQNDNTGKTIEGRLEIRKDALPDYVYWNDNLSGTFYTSTQVPTGTGLNGTYQTREQLAAEYSNWSNTPIYIKTTKVNGTVTGHTACLWYNNREFCMGPNYWVETGNGDEYHQSEENGSATKAKLKADMENALGITIADSSCDSDTSHAYCSAGDFGCYTYSNGIATCGSLVVRENCAVYKSGEAICYEW